MYCLHPTGANLSVKTRFAEGSTMITRLTRRQWLTFVLPIVLVCAAVLFISAKFFRPAPPTTIIISTGGVDGAYQKFALQYATRLAKEGITLEIKPSKGSIENLERLRDAERSADVAFIQGGLGYLSLNPKEAPSAAITLQSLATVMYEPVWIFTRDKTRDSLLDLSGLRVAIGPEGSGTRKVALDLLTDAGLPSAAMKLEPVTNLAAVEQFKAGTIDAMVLVASPQAPSVQTMLRLPEAHLVNVAQSQALARRVPYLQPILFPQGVVDIKGNIPPRDTTLLTTTANLVMRDDLHPALAFLLLDAANSIHGAPGILNRPGDFPSSKATDFPLADEAKRYFSTGRPFFQRYLPFWLANLAERLLIILIPLMAVAIPLIKMIPDIYKWRMDGRLYKWYGELMRMERDLFANQISDADVPRHVAMLNQMERDATELKLPLDYSDKIYTLRQHIDYVRARLNNSMQSKSYSRVS
jgi:TRAP transporter TAXI family solute receptor